MSDFVWDSPSTWNGLQVDLNFDSQGISERKFIRQNHSYHRSSIHMWLHIQSIIVINSFSIGQLRGTAKSHLGGALHETNIATVSKSVQLSTAPQQALSTVPLYNYVFCYFCFCARISLFL